MEENSLEEMCKQLMMRRTKRLFSLLKSNAPSFIIATEVHLIFRAAIGICGKDLMEKLHEWMLEKVRLECDFCVLCGKKIMGICPECDRPSLCIGCEFKKEVEEE